MNVSQPSTGVTPVQIYDLSKESVILVTAKWQTLYGLEPFSSGSGFIYDREGHIIMNNHVIEDADAIDVTSGDGTILPAELVGADPYSDLAVIRVEGPADLLHPLPVGSPSELLVGESVMAIGNPFGLSNSMSLGIVSQLGRELDAPGNYKIVDVIQVDAAINPGNSGGPLMNMRGEVVGVNTAIIIGSVGVGFAIPSDTVIREVPQLIQTGQYRHPWIGISSMDIDPDIAAAMGLTITKGMVVVYVSPDSPAELAGIKAGTQTTTVGGRTVMIGGDVIVGVDDVEVRRLIDAIVYIERNKKPGDTVSFKIIREGELLNLDLTLGVRPPL
ncbi:MAG: trypsin-like peptidase domain-containing protein [archaeon]|nr:trypsin-like peptidase domain-containing protein [archaeon]